jgi:hypothetical protein
MTITRNAARCRKCDTVIESRSVHDFVSCRCGAIFVDGGLEYGRSGGSPEDFESLSEYLGGDDV